MGKRESYAVTNIVTQKQSSQTHYFKVIVKYYSVALILQNHASDYYEVFILRQEAHL